MAFRPAYEGPSSTGSRPGSPARRDDRQLGLARHRAAALAQIKPKDRRVVPFLVQAFAGQGAPSKEAGDRVRSASLAALGAMGPAAQEAVPFLARTAVDQHYSVEMRLEAQAALNRVDPLGKLRPRYDD